MRKTAVTLTVATLVLGIFGAFFRWLQNSSAFEPETGCAIPGHATSVVFVLYCIVAAAVICVAALLYFRRFAAEKSVAALRGETVVPTVVGWVLGVLFVLAALVTLFTAHHAKYPMLQRFLGAFGILAGLCLPFLAGKPEPGGAFGRAASALVTLFFCFWLIFSYRLHSEDPVVWHYCVEILALALSTTAFYYVTAFHFGAGRGSRALGAVQLAVFFDIATIFDARSTAGVVMLVATAAMLLMIEYLLIANLNERRDS